MTKKIFVFCFIFINISFAYTLNDIKKLYINKKYAKVCSLSGSMYVAFKNDENFLNMFADSCLKSDMVNRMVLPIIKLYKTKQARENAAYFTTILYQKKMLYYALCNNIDISYINLPKTNYILSKIFDKFVKGEYDLKNGSYWFSDDKNIAIKYRLSLEERNNIKKMYLRTYKNNKIIKIRVYW
ncbi:MAG: hypothetical protein QM482_06580 [Sulfurospirillum sp.]